jgi:hypothetical protein
VERSRIVYLVADNEKFEQEEAVIVVRRKKQSACQQKFVDSQSPVTVWTDTVDKIE